MITKQNDDMPEDKRLSSGYSVIRGNMVKIDNYENVVKYEYKQSKRGKTFPNEFTLLSKKYVFLNEIDIFAHPNTLKDTMDAFEEYPQGLCITNEYVFISLYSNTRGNMGKIKVYEKQSGEFLLALGMDESSHLGGLAFDGKYIWVCNSSKMSVERISYAFIQEMIQKNKGKMIDARNLVDAYRVKNIPSTVTFHDGLLWVATHSVLTPSAMTAYDYSAKKEQLSVHETIFIPPQVQGVAFSDKGEVYFSTSYGRKNSSYIRKYRSMDVLSDDIGNYSEMIEMPPCAEGISYEKGSIYVLFESAGLKYLEGTDGKGKSLSPLNRILKIME